MLGVVGIKYIGGYILFSKNDMNCKKCHLLGEPMSGYLDFLMKR